MHDKLSWTREGMGNSMLHIQLRLLQCKGDTMLGFDIVGHTHDQIAVMLVSNDSIVNSSSDKYGL